MRVPCVKQAGAVILAALTLVLWPGLTPAASAATVQVTGLTVTVSPQQTTAGWNEVITTTMTFCTPDSASANDTFTVALPPVLTAWAPTFTVKDPNGVLVYTGTVSGSPAVATFTLTAEGAGIPGACSKVTMTATVGRASAGSYPLVFTLNGAQQVSAGTMVVSNPTYTAPTTTQKNAWFTISNDQCRSAGSLEACLTFRVRSKAAPGQRVVIDDPAGANWVWACAAIANQPKLTVNTYANGGITPRNDRDPAVAAMILSYQCTPDRLQVELDTSTVGPDQNIELLARATATAPGGQGGVLYHNDATVTADGTPATFSVDLTSTRIGGTATVDGLQVTKSDTAGHAADTQADAVSLPSGETGLVIRVTNTGTSALRSLTVSDRLVTGAGTVNDLSCDFSPVGGPATGATWDGPLEPTKGFTCTGQLTGVVGTHQDRVEVTATGNSPVAATNDFWAQGPPPSVNLALTKAEVLAGPYSVGSTVTFTLTPSNTGNTPAQAGWSVTEVLPAGLELVSMTGSGYTCHGATCTAQAALPRESDGEPVTVTVRATAEGAQHSVAYVSPAAGDLAESNPLVVPDTTTDTAASPTDNDAQVTVQVAPAPQVALAKSAAGRADGTYTVSFVVSNPGQVPLRDLAVTDQVTGAGVLGQVVCDYSGVGGPAGGGPQWAGPLAPGAEYTCTATLSGVTGAHTDEARVTATGNGVSASAASSLNLPGPAGTNLTLTKAETSSGSYAIGGTVTFTLTPRNTSGVVASAGWSVTEVLPAGLELVSMTG
ncbi:MAG: hypothetical protein Q4G45_06150, partial [Actinomycetia bacterium]|nr:hypothetical protein [Actinomycetes bacterium]